MSTSVDLPLGMAWPVLEALLLGGAAAVLVTVSPRIPPRYGWALVPAALGAAIVGSVSIALGAALAGLCVWSRLRRRKRRRHAMAERRAWVRACDDLSADLRAGAVPSVALRRAAERCVIDVEDTPRVIWTFGTGGEVASEARNYLIDAAARVDLGGVPHRHTANRTANRLGAAWHVSTTYGGPLAIALAHVHDDVLATDSFVADLDARLAGAEATTAILVALPFLALGLGVLSGARPDFSGLLAWVVPTGIGLIGLGLLWSDRIIDGVRGAAR